MSHRTAASPAPADTLIGSTERCFTVAVPWKPLVWRLCGARAEEHLLKVGKGCAETADEEDADEEAAKPRDKADDDVDRPQALRPDESRGADDRDEGVRGEQSDDEREQDHDPGDAGDAGDAGKEQRLRAGLRADAVDHSHTERGLRTVLGRVDRRRVLVAVDARLQGAPAVADEVEDEHPSAPKPELTLAAQVLVDGEEYPDTEQDERYADDLFEDRIDPGRQHRAEEERGNPKDQDDEGVAERVD